MRRDQTHPTSLRTAGMVLSADDRRMNRGSAFLMGVAVVCGTATVTFGIWMASYSQHLHG